MKSEVFSSRFRGSKSPCFAAWFCTTQVIYLRNYQSRTEIAKGPKLEEPQNYILLTNELFPRVNGI